MKRVLLKRLREQSARAGAPGTSTVAADIGTGVVIGSEWWLRELIARDTGGRAR